MKVSSHSWFENKTRTCQIAFCAIEDISEVDMNPEFVDVENWTDGDMIFVDNTHVYGDAPQRGEHSVGFWRVKYREQS